jgi:hypothetical protein
MNIIDKSKFSREKLEEIFQKNKLEMEEKSKLQINTDCQTLKDALTKFINTDYYLKKTKNNLPINHLTSSYFYVYKLNMFDDIESNCGINFPAISKELSEATQKNVTVTLFYKNDENRTEHYFDLREKEIVK